MKIPKSTALKEVPFPPISEPLIDRLDRMFPEACPDPKDTEREIWMKAGERRVARMLRTIFNQQNERA